MAFAGLPAMAINGAWNNRCGPGGSTRRLHQILGGLIQTARLCRYVIRALGGILMTERIARSLNQAARYKGAKQTRHAW